jgi:hypothetical protein
MDIGSRLVSHCHSLLIPEPRPTKNLCVGNSGGGAHGRISDDRYRASFSDSHRFHVSEGDFHNRRFQYGGYSFGFIDPWPQGWLYTDDVYIVYADGGYYMFDAFHPRIRIAINIL